MNECEYFVRHYLGKGTAADPKRIKETCGLTGGPCLIYPRELYYYNCTRRTFALDYLNLHPVPDLAKSPDLPPPALEL
jgi:hypothetical protein